MGTEWKQSDDGFSVIEVGSPEPKLGAGNAANDTGAVSDADVGDYDPSDHNVGDVKSYVTENPDTAEAVLAAERDGKDRSSLVGWLEDFGSDDAED